MEKNRICRGVSGKLTVYLLLGLIFPQIHGLPLTNDGKRTALVPPLKQPISDHGLPQRKIGEMTPKDLEDAIQAKVEDFEEERKKCGIGNFLSPATNNCQSCDKYCQGGKNMKACGRECEVYYLKTEIKKLRQRTEGLEENMQRIEKDSAGSPTTSLWIAFAFLSICVVIFNIIMVPFARNWVKLQIAVLERTVVGQIEDLQKKLHRQATPDVTPTGTLRAHSATETHQQDNGSAVEQLLFYVSEG